MAHRYFYPVSFIDKELRRPTDVQQIIDILDGLDFRKKEGIGMNRRLAEAVVAVFKSDTKEEVLYAFLAAFSERTWLQNCNWLDSSGLALYFLRRIKELHIEGAVPAKVLQRLEKNTADNLGRSASMFAEFIKINKIFLEADLTYINIKGFTL